MGGAERTAEICHRRHGATRIAQLPRGDAELLQLLTRDAGGAQAGERGGVDAVRVGQHHADTTKQSLHRTQQLRVHVGPGVCESVPAKLDLVVGVLRVHKAIVEQQLRRRQARPIRVEHFFAGFVVAMGSEHSALRFLIECQHRLASRCTAVVQEVRPGNEGQLAVRSRSSVGVVQPYAARGPALSHQFRVVRKLPAVVRLGTVLCAKLEVKGAAKEGGGRPAQRQSRRFRALNNRRAASRHNDFSVLLHHAQPALQALLHRGAFQQ
mmetsp:Transcript_23519/g.41790  ORF Transcript_23519/g.41790 Transcript_23519/m.41790 type:complete len:267 (-) Transcript_23519:12-812(-)